MLAASRPLATPGSNLYIQSEEVFAGDYKVRRARQKRYIALRRTFEDRLTFVVFGRFAQG
jgi:hypothetical protein